MEQWREYKIRLHVCSDSSCFTVSTKLILDPKSRIRVVYLPCNIIYGPCFVLVSAMMPPTKSSSASSSSLQAAISSVVDKDITAEKKREEREKEKKELEKKNAEEEGNQTLEQQETMKISGSNARHMVMQKLMRQSQVIVLYLYQTTLSKTRPNCKDLQMTK